MTKEEAQAITGNTNSTTNDLRTTGAEYWLGTVNGSKYLCGVHFDGWMSDFGSYSFGFRPVIVLKSSVFTSGKGEDQVGNQDAWLLA